MQFDRYPEQTIVKRLDDRMEVRKHVIDRYHRNRRPTEPHHTRPSSLSVPRRESARLLLTHSD